MGAQHKYGNLLHHSLCIVYTCRETNGIDIPIHVELNSGQDILEYC